MNVPVRHTSDGPVAVILVGPRRRELLVDPDIAARLRGAVIVECGGQPVRQFTRAGRKCRENVSRIVVNAPPRVQVQRRNRNPFDCRRANLYTSPGIVSRSPHQAGNKWRAQVPIDGRRYFLGYWPTREWALDVCALAAPVAVTLRGRDLTRFAIQRALDIATGRRIEGLP